MGKGNMSSNCISIASVHASRLGDVWLAMSVRGLIAVEYGVRREVFEASLQKLLQPRRQYELGAGSQAAHDAARQIAEYLNGQRHHFELRIDWAVLGSDFQRTTLQAVMAIPYGETRTYGEIAAQIGRPNAPRAVGRANATNPMPLVIPCHRVIGSDGKLHGYGGAGGLKTKKWLLEMESARARAEHVLSVAS